MSPGRKGAVTGFRIGTLFGVSVRIHPLFLLLLAALVILASERGGSQGLRRTILLLSALPAEAQTA